MSAAPSANSARNPCPKDTRCSSEPWGKLLSRKEPRYPLPLWKGCHVNRAVHNSEGTIHVQIHCAYAYLLQQFPNRCQWSVSRKQQQRGCHDSLPRPGCVLPGTPTQLWPRKGAVHSWAPESSYFHPCLHSPPLHPASVLLPDDNKQQAHPQDPPTGNVLFLKQNGGFRGVHFIMLYNLCTCYIYSF